MVRLFLNSKRRIIITTDIEDLWAIDLIILMKMMVIIKDGISFSKAFGNIIEQTKLQNNQAPKLLHADKCLEFEDKHFKNVLQKYGITHKTKKNWQ